MNADCNSSRANYSPHFRITGLVLDFRDVYAQVSLLFVPPSIQDEGRGNCLLPLARWSYANLVGTLFHLPPAFMSAVRR